MSAGNFSELMIREQHFEAMSHLEVYIPVRVAAAVAPAVSSGHEVCYGISSVLRGMQSLLLTINGDSNLGDTGHSVLVYVNVAFEMSKGKQATK